MPAPAQFALDRKVAAGHAVDSWAQDVTDEAAYSETIDATRARFAALGYSIRVNSVQPGVIDTACYVTGAEFVVDGGMFAG